MVCLESSEIAKILGLPNADSSTLYDLATGYPEGFPVESVERLARQLAPDDPKFMDNLISRSTLHRRRRQGTLSTRESDLVYRLSSVWLAALRTFGDEAKARHFLFRPHGLLRGQIPIQLATENAPGAELVDQILGRLRFGSAA